MKHQRVNIFSLIVFLTLSIIGQSQTLIPYYSNGKYGYCDTKGNISIEPQYNHVEFFTENGLAFVDQGDRKILINKQGETLATFDNNINTTLYPVGVKNNKTPTLLTNAEPIDHLKWIKIDRQEFRLINLKSHQISSVYLSDPKPILSYVDYRSTGPRGENTKSFLNGYFIGLNSDQKYDILNTDLEVIKTTEEKPKIWNDDLISYTSSNESILYRPSTGQNVSYPYKSVLNVIDEKYIVVSNRKIKGQFMMGYHRDAKTGVVDINGDLLIDTIYQQVSYHQGIFILKKDNQSFLIDEKGNKITSQKYSYITSLNDSLFKARIDDKFEILNIKGESIFGNQLFEDFSYQKTKNYYLAKAENYAAILDEHMSLEIKYKADAIYRDDQMKDRYIVAINDARGMIDSEKKIILPVKCDRISSLDENLIKIHKNDLVGIADASGKMIIDPEYESIRVKVKKGDSLIMTSKNGLYAAFSLSGEQLSGFTITDINTSQHNVNWHHRDGTYHFTDDLGTPLNLSSKNFFTGYTKNDSVFIVVLNSRDTIHNILIDGVKFEDWGKGFDSLVSVGITQGLIGVAKGDQQAVVDVKGNVILPFSSQKIMEINNHYILTKREEKYYLFDGRANSINRIGYDYISDTKTSPRAVAINIPDQYYEYVTNPCLTGRQDTILKKQKYFGYIDEFGEVVVPPEYNSTFRFFEDYAYLSKGYIDGQKQSVLVDTAGNVILTVPYDFLYPLYHTDTSGYYKARRNGKYGLIDRKGNVIIPVMYDVLQGFCDDDLLRVKDKDGNWPLINFKNEIIYSKNNLGRVFSEKYSRISDDKILIFPDGKTEVIDLRGQKILEIDSQKFKFVKRSNVELIEVDMDDYKYYINKESLIEYKST